MMQYDSIAALAAPAAFGAGVATGAAMLNRKLFNKIEHGLRRTLWGAVPHGATTPAPQDAARRALQRAAMELRTPYFDAESRAKLRRIKLWYPQALCARALEISHRYDGHNASLSALVDFYNRYIDAYGNFRHTGILRFPDNCMHGWTVAYMHACTGEERYRHCTDVFASFLAGLNRSTSGLIPYRKTLPSLLLVDTVGMICPFLARYGALIRKPEAINDAVAHALDIIDNAMDCRSGLPFHGHVDKGAPVGIAGWARGTGWFLLGLAGILEYLPPDHDAGEKLKDTVRRMAKKLRAFQRSDGCWGWAITNPFSTPETSGTALIAFSLLTTRLLGIIGEEHDALIHDAYRGVCNAMTTKGYVLGASGDCVYGPGVYPTKFSHQMWAQGAAAAFLTLYAHWRRSRYAADADSERNESISTDEGKKSTTTGKARGLGFRP